MDAATRISLPISLIILVLSVSTMSSGTRMGECPVPRNTSAGVCMTSDMCGSNDSNCQYPQKCCPNECGGRICMYPQNSTVGKKPGYCPAVQPGTFGTCVEMCNHDMNCTGNLKCCSNGCGHTCQPPVQETPCRNYTVYSKIGASMCYGHWYNMTLETTLAKKCMGFMNLSKCINESMKAIGYSCTKDDYKYLMEKNGDMIYNDSKVNVSACMDLMTPCRNYSLYSEIGASPMCLKHWTAMTAASTLPEKCMGFKNLSNCVNETMKSRNHTCTKEDYMYFMEKYRDKINHDNGFNVSACMDLMTPCRNYSLYSEIGASPMCMKHWTAMTAASMLPEKCMGFKNLSNCVNETMKSRNHTCTKEDYMYFMEKYRDRINRDNGFNVSACMDLMKPCRNYSLYSEIGASPMCMKHWNAMTAASMLPEKCMGFMNLSKCVNETMKSRNHTCTKEDYMYLMEKYGDKINHDNGFNVSACMALVPPCRNYSIYSQMATTNCSDQWYDMLMTPFFADKCMAFSKAKECFNNTMTSKGHFCKAEDYKYVEEKYSDYLYRDAGFYVSRCMELPHKECMNVSLTSSFYTKYCPNLATESTAVQNDPVATCKKYDELFECMMKGFLEMNMTQCRREHMNYVMYHYQDVATQFYGTDFRHCKLRCLNGSHDCHPNADCHYAKGTAYNCTCRLGYSGDGKQCHAERCSYTMYKDTELVSASGEAFMLTASNTHTAKECIDECEKVVTSTSVCEGVLYEPDNGGSCTLYMSDALPSDVIQKYSYGKDYYKRNCSVKAPSCPPGVPVALCSARPCDVTHCKRYPNAICKDDYCGGCHARFYDQMGKELDCNAKPGYCQFVPPGTFGTCAQFCDHDLNCTGNLKCCSNGCGHTCQPPVHEAPCRNYTVYSQIGGSATCIQHWYNMTSATTLEKKCMGFMKLSKCVNETMKSRNHTCTKEDYMYFMEKYRDRINQDNGFNVSACMALVPPCRNYSIYSQMATTNCSDQWYAMLMTPFIADKCMAFSKAKECFNNTMTSKGHFCKADDYKYVEEKYADYLYRDAGFYVSRCMELPHKECLNVNLTSWFYTKHCPNLATESTAVQNDPVATCKKFDELVECMMTGFREIYMPQCTREHINYLIYQFQDAATHFYGTDFRHCKLQCLKGSHDCHPNADCHYAKGTAYNCTCRPGYSGDGKQCHQDTSPCPPGVPIALCFARPCDVTSCKRYPNASCKDDYCGGCHARFYDQMGKELDCSVTKPGHCPVVPPGTFGTCVEMCNHDMNCTGNLKCCSNGCGHTCQPPAPVTLAIKRGTCPYVKPTMNGPCVKQCQTDSDCKYEFKCCSSGCNQTCQWPEFKKCAGAVAPARDQNGMELFCGMGINTTTCPKGTVCDVHPADAFAACCNRTAPPRIIGPSFQRVIAKVSTNASLPCPVVGFPSVNVTWMVFEESLPLVGPRHSVSANGTLNITKVEVNDTGSYNCIAKNSEGYAIVALYLQVLVPESPCRNYSYYSQVGSTACSHHWLTMTSASVLHEKCMSFMNLSKCVNDTMKSYGHNCTAEDYAYLMETYGHRMVNDNQFNFHQCFEKPGKCPALPPGTSGVCVHGCDNDWNCTGQQKCCFNGCGWMCQDPEKQPAMPEIPTKCRYPADSGPCEAYMPHYYFNTTTKQCQKFVYGGCQGNDNRFTMKSDCLNTCSPCRNYSAYAMIGGNACLKHWNAMTSTSYLPSKCSAFFNMSKCVDNAMRSKGYICTEDDQKYLMEKYSKRMYEDNGFNFSKCSDMHPVMPEIPAKCKQPADTGPCKAYMPHFYFNTTTKQCQIFVYGGCQGNDNRFAMKSDCMNACSPCRNYSVYSMIGGNACLKHWNAMTLTPSLPRKCLAFFNLSMCINNALKMNGYMCTEDDHKYLMEKYSKRMYEENGFNFTKCYEPEPPCRNYSVYAMIAGTRCTKHLNAISSTSFLSEQCSAFMNLSNCINGTLKSRGLNCTPMDFNYVEEKYGEHMHQDIGFNSSKCHYKPMLDIPAKCKVPAVSVQCNGRYPQYFFDEKTKKCRSFENDGCGGNENSFSTKWDCERTCLNKPGSCPKPGVAGFCVQECNHDLDCADDNKCCSNGCGWVCKAAEHKIRVKKGSCPKVQGGMFGTCVESCKTDDDCDEMQKCCSNGCGHTCQSPRYFKCNNVTNPLLNNDGTEYYCGRDGERCPSTHDCDIHPSDNFAVCCRRGLQGSLGPKTVMAKPNSPAILPCKAKSVSGHSVSWSKGGKTIPVKGYNYYIAANGSLVFDRVNSKSSGMYTCTLMGDFGTKLMLNVTLKVMHIGTCPAKHPVVDCVNIEKHFRKCRVDADCEYAHLCCDTGCGLVCIKPDNKTRCQKEKEMSLMKLVEVMQNKDLCTPVHIPRCSQNGDYHRVQCRDQMGICWCVHPNGTKINGTETRGNPDCSRAAKPGHCPSIEDISKSDVICPAADKQCKSDLNCTGVQKCCANGCAYVCMEPKDKAMMMMNKTKDKEEKVCPDGSSPKCCDVSLCMRHHCPRNPEAVCRVNPCRNCEVEFFDRMNATVNCTEGLTKCQIHLMRSKMMISGMALGITSMANHTLEHIQNETMLKQGMNFGHMMNSTKPPPTMKPTMKPPMMPNTTNVCSLPKKTGPCRAYFRRYYYNVRTGKCETFIYGGCDSNGNNFETEEQCYSVCNRSKIYSPEGSFVPVCAAEGHYASQQCHGAVCFCVNKTGGYIKGSIRIGHVDCTKTEFNMTHMPKCPNGNLPVPCMYACMKAKCPAHPEARCFANPCDDCKVTFKDKNKMAVQCEEVNPCDYEVPDMMTKTHRPSCSNTHVRYYFDKQSQTCKEFKYNFCDGDDKYLKSEYQCQAKCKGTVCDGKGPRFCTTSCFNQTCMRHPKAMCHVDPCTCQVLFIDPGSGKKVDCAKGVPSICELRRANESEAFMRWKSMQPDEMETDMGKDEDETDKGTDPEPEGDDEKVDDDDDDKKDGGDPEPDPEGKDDDDDEGKGDTDSIKNMEEMEKPKVLTQCHENGKFVKQQCDGKEYCWCVDGMGNADTQTVKRVESMDVGIGCPDNDTAKAKFTMKFDVDPELVRNNEEQFKEAVLRRCLVLSDKFDRVLNTDNMKIRYGSVYVDFEFTKSDDTDLVALTSVLGNAVRAGDFKVEHGGTVMTADPTIASVSFIFEAQIQQPEPTTEQPTPKPEPKQDQTTIIIVVVVVVVVVILVILIAVVVVRRNSSKEKGYLEDNIMGAPPSGKSNGVYFDSTFPTSEKSFDSTLPTSEKSFDSTLPTSEKPLPTSEKPQNLYTSIIDVRL